MADYVPHPLVTRVGMKVARLDDVALNHSAIRAADALDQQAAQAQAANKQAAQALSQAIEAADSSAGAETSPDDSPPPAGPLTSFDPIDIDSLSPLDKQTLANGLAERGEVPDLTLFAGFLGGQLRGRWRLLYLDARLFSWLLLEESDILVHQRMNDDRAPCGVRDVLWVRKTANVVQGTGAQSSEGRFLVGEFTRAGDFAASTTGGTFSAASGLLCEATTPGCCAARRTG